MVEEKTKIMEHLPSSQFVPGLISAPHSPLCPRPAGTGAVAMGGCCAAGQALLGLGQLLHPPGCCRAFLTLCTSSTSGISPFIKCTLPEAPPQRAPPALLRVAPAAPGPAMGHVQPRTVVDAFIFFSFF